MSFVAWTRSFWERILAAMSQPADLGAHRQLLDVKGLLENTDNAFRWELCQVADRLQVNPDFLTAVMSVETGTTFSPSIKNPNGGATGLIQFIPPTAKMLGTTTAALASMSAVEQLHYVEKYYRPFTGKMHSPEDVYMATFMPSGVGKGAGNVLGVEGAEGFSGKVYAANKGLDTNKDGVITNGEVGGLARGRIAGAQSRPLIDVFPESSGNGASVAGLLLLALGAGLLWRGVRG